MTQEQQLTTAVGRCCCSSHNQVKRCVVAYSSLSDTRNTATSVTAERKRTKAGENERPGDFQTGKKAMDSQVNDCKKYLKLTGSIYLCT